MCYFLMATGSSKTNPLVGFFRFYLAHHEDQCRVWLELGETGFPASSDQLKISHIEMLVTINMLGKTSTPNFGELVEGTGIYLSS
jgi:hypothetical protein